jgi:archaellum biogenesis ATPase FlaH
MSNEILASDFVIEIFAYALNDVKFFDIIRKYLKYNYLQTEAEKKLLKWIFTRYDKTGRIPTSGQIRQNFIEDEKVLDLYLEVSEVDIDDIGFEEVVRQFEAYVKKMLFLDANDRITDLYNKGNRDGAWDLFVKYADDFSKFTIQDAKFETVFSDFELRQTRRKSEGWNKRYKIPTAIDELDYRLGGENGGVETGECVLWLGDSGAGKSQCLVHLGIAAARQGFRVAHFQLEGTKEQCLNRYDAAWTGTLYKDMKLGNITEKKLDVSRKIIEKLRKSDIIVSSEETFNAKTLVDVRRELKEMEKKYGKIDVVLIDYLELLEVGDGHNYTPSEERFRQAKLARGMKMLAMEFNAVVHTATQSCNIPEDLKNDPEFVITRAQLSEDKGKIRPFDIFVTINQTRDEAKDEIMRLHTDKLREHKNGTPIMIANNFAYSRFYDRKRTFEIIEDYED